MKVKVFRKVGFFMKVIKVLGIIIVSTILALSIYAAGLTLNIDLVICFWVASVIGVGFSSKFIIDIIKGDL